MRRLLIFSLLCGISFLGFGQKSQLDTLQSAKYINAFMQQSGFGSPNNNVWLLTGKKITKLKDANGKDITYSVSIEMINAFDVAGWDYVEQHLEDGKYMYLFKRR